MLLFVDYFCTEYKKWWTRSSYAHCSWKCQKPLLYLKHVSTHSGLYQEVQKSASCGTKCL